MKPESSTETLGSELSQDWLFGQCRRESVPSQERDVHNHVSLWPENEETWFCLEGEKRSLNILYDAGFYFIGDHAPGFPFLN